MTKVKICAGNTIHKNVFFILSSFLKGQDLEREICVKSWLWSQRKLVPNSTVSVWGACMNDSKNSCVYGQNSNIIDALETIHWINMRIYAFLSEFSKTYIAM